MIIDYDYLASEFSKCYQDKSRIYMIQNYLKTFDATRKKDVFSHKAPARKKTNNIFTNSDG